MNVDLKMSFRDYYARSSGEINGYVYLKYLDHSIFYLDPIFPLTITVAFLGRGYGVHTLSIKQSSVIFHPEIYVWKHAMFFSVEFKVPRNQKLRRFAKYSPAIQWSGDVLVSTLPFQAFRGWGFSNLSSPTGGSAYGILRNFWTLIPGSLEAWMIPRILPDVVVITVEQMIQMEGLSSGVTRGKH